MPYRNDGVLRQDDLRGRLPSEERLRRGPVVIIECVENIPCNPCVAACPRHAISIDGDINGTPAVDFESCNGCALCLSACPGLAIFAVDMSGDGDAATLLLPYEYTPLPEVGEEVTAIDRSGESAGAARVKRVLNTKAMDRTPVISLEVPRKKAMEIRHFTRRSKQT